MSDPLDRAVDARIAADRPAVVPPFEVIEARKHRRDRRRGTGAAALSLLAVVAVAGGSALLAGDQDRQPSRSVIAAGPQAAPGPHTEFTERRCAAAAQGYGGEVAGHFPATVADVRAFMLTTSDDDGASVGRTAPFAVPSGWDSRSPDDRAAACYVDGIVALPAARPDGASPADRALVMAAAGVEPFLVKAGPEDAITPAPLPASRTGTVTLPTSAWTPGGGADMAAFSRPRADPPSGQVTEFRREPAQPARGPHNPWRSTDRTAGPPGPAVLQPLPSAVLGDRPRCARVVRGNAVGATSWSRGACGRHPRSRQGRPPRPR